MKLEFALENIGGKSCSLVDVIFPNKNKKLRGNSVNEVLPGRIWGGERQEGEIGGIKLKESGMNKEDKMEEAYREREGSFLPSLCFYGEG